MLEIEGCFPVTKRKQAARDSRHLYLLWLRVCTTLSPLPSFLRKWAVLGGEQAVFGGAPSAFQAMLLPNFFTGEMTAVRYKGNLHILCKLNNLKFKFCLCRNQISIWKFQINLFLRSKQHAEFVSLPEGRRIITHRFVSPLRPFAFSEAAATCLLLLHQPAGQEHRGIQLGFLSVYRESHHFSLYRGGDLLCAYLFIFAIGSETFI